MLRNLGFKPSNANKVAIQEALDQRPNQAPLVEALKETIAYQRRIQAQAAAQQQQQQVLSPASRIGGRAGCRFDQGRRDLGGPGGSSINMPVG